MEHADDSADFNDSTDSNSARHGQNQEKVKISTTELKIFLSEFFLTENNNKSQHKKINEKKMAPSEALKSKSIYQTGPFLPALKSKATRKIMPGNVV